MRRALLFAMAGLAICASTVNAVPRRPATPGRPNVLILVSDDQTISTFNRSLMPAVYAELVDQGVTFDKAYDVSALCCPSRSEILTGLYEHHTGVDDNDVSLSRPTIVEALHEAGYRTSLTGKYLNHEPCDRRAEFDQWVCYSFEMDPDPYVDPILNVDGTQVQETGYSTDILAQFTADFIQGTPADQPFFAMYTPISPHLPADDPRCAGLPVERQLPPSYDEDTQTDGKPAYVQRGPLSDREQTVIGGEFKRMTQAVECLDPGMQTILGSLGDRTQDTIVFYISDNGFMYGEHRRWAKEDPYEESVHVPFLIRYPAMAPEPFTSDALVENVDIPVTVMDLAGIPWSADGTSLVPLLSGQATSVRADALIEHCQGVNYPCHSYLQRIGFGANVTDPSWTGVTDGHWKYTEYVTGERELYDLDSDPYELANVADDPSTAEIQAALATSLQSLMAPPPTDTTIVEGPQGTVGPGSYRFRFFSQSRFATYQCRLDQDSGIGEWGSCPGQSALVGPLGPGSYVFNVMGTDENGVSDPSPATRAFTVSGATPDVAITSSPDIHVKTTIETFTFESTTLGATFECRLAQWVATAGWEPCDASGVTYGPLAEGYWHFQVRAVDPDTGQTSDPPAEWTFWVDESGPDVSWVRAPADPTNVTDAEIVFVPTEATSGPITCQLDGADPVDCSGGVFSASGLAAIRHTLRVVASDAIGNQSTPTYSWLVDLTPPGIGASLDVGRFTNSTTARFALTSSSKVMFWCSLDGEPGRGCASPAVYVGLADGPHAFSAYAVDFAGNASRTVSLSWTVDTIAPIATITSGPEQITSSHKATFEFTADETPVRFLCTLDGGPAYACPSGITFKGLASGSHEFTVAATDRASNLGPAADWSWTIV